LNVISKFNQLIFSLTVISINDQSTNANLINEAIIEVDHGTQVNVQTANEVNEIASRVKDMSSTALEDIKKNKF
jgi:methyl-accepting chemotaxis protein